MPHEIEEIIFEGLDYNAKMCVDSSGPENRPKITYQQVVENPKLNPRYGWQDFEPLLKFVPKLGGIPKAFISRAVKNHGGRTIAAPGIYQNVSLLDINSLYPAALAELRIPISKPSVWNCSVNLSEVVDFVADIDIIGIARPRPFYPKLHIGEMTCTKIELEDVIKYCGIRYRIIRGYYWVGPTIDVKEYIHRIYDKKNKACGGSGIS
jgi:hypothetical protein